MCVWERGEVAPGTRHEFLLENEDSGTDSCSWCVFVNHAHVDVVTVVIVLTPQLPLTISTCIIELYEVNVKWKREKRWEYKEKEAHCSFHSVVVMVRPSVSVVMAQCFCCSSREMKELPRMCGFVCVRVSEREDWNKWRAKSTETVRNGPSVHPIRQKRLWRSNVRGYGCVNVSGHIMLCLLIFCVMLLYIKNSFFCVVHSSICHHFDLKIWPTFSCASALCLGSVGLHDELSWVYCRICFLFKLTIV